VTVTTAEPRGPTASASSPRLEHDDDVDVGAGTGDHYTGAIPAQQGNSHPLLCPFDILPTADGWVALAANNQQWVIVANTIGRPDMATDERYATNAARVRNRTEVLAAVEPWLAAHTTKEVVETFGGTVSIGPVNTAADIFADPHVAARGMLVPIEQPGSDVPVTVTGQPIKFTQTPSASGAAVPSSVSITSTTSSPTGPPANDGVRRKKDDEGAHCH
jgi:crotonobetainyl-CoA:carnitine CoA-transferase CaiB-like acyl-CoA transferase